MRVQIWSLTTFWVWAGAVSASQLATPVSYQDLCDASAGTYIYDEHFVVASDKSNILRRYAKEDRSQGVALDFEDESGFDKSDAEASARIGDTIYRISSHSLNNCGEDTKKRKIFFATRIVSSNNATTLQWEKKFLPLRDAILEKIGDRKSELNVEGLTMASDGALLIGLRDTMDGKAVVIPLENPAEVILHPEKKAVLGTPIHLNLRGRGIRSIERVDDQYLILAGPGSDGGDFSLYRWAGGDALAEEKTFEFGS